MFVCFFVAASRDIENRAPVIEMDEETPEADVFVRENETISLACRVGGWPEPRLIFYKDGKRLRPNENVSLGN